MKLFFKYSGLASVLLFLVIAVVSCEEEETTVPVLYYLASIDTETQQTSIVYNDDLLPEWILKTDEQDKQVDSTQLLYDEQGHLNMLINQQSDTTYFTCSDSLISIVWKTYLDYERCLEFFLDQQQAVDSIRYNKQQVYKVESDWFGNVTLVHKADSSVLAFYGFYTYDMAQSPYRAWPLALKLWWGVNPGPNNISIHYLDRFRGEPYAYHLKRKHQHIYDHNNYPIKTIRETYYHVGYDKLLYSDTLYYEYQY